MLKKLNEFQFREVMCRLPEQMKCYSCHLAICSLQFHFYFLQGSKYCFKVYCYHKHKYFVVCKISYYVVTCYKSAVFMHIAYYVFDICSSLKQIRRVVLASIFTAITVSSMFFLFFFFLILKVI